MINKHPTVERSNPPSNLVATAADEVVSLEWEIPSYDGNLPILEYRVYRSYTRGGPYTYIASTPALEFTDTTVVNLQTYYYVVTAFNGIKESLYSNEVFVTPSILPTTTGVIPTTTAQEPTSEVPTTSSKIKSEPESSTFPNMLVILVILSSLVIVTQKQKNSK